MFFKELVTRPIFTAHQFLFTLHVFTFSVFLLVGMRLSFPLNPSRPIKSQEHVSKQKQPRCKNMRVTDEPLYKAFVFENFFFQRFGSGCGKSVFEMLLKGGWARLWQDVGF